MIATKEAYEKLGVKMPLFMEGVEVPDNFFDPPDPLNYLTPDIRIDLSALVKYAKRAGREVADITKEEIQQFVLDDEMYSKPLLFLS
jgi:hypothetical protein